MDKQTESRDGQRIVSKSLIFINFFSSITSLYRFNGTKLEQIIKDQNILPFDNEIK